MTHIRKILRPTMSSLLDVVSENEKARAASGRCDIRSGSEAAKKMATYFGQYISEMHSPQSERRV